MEESGDTVSPPPAQLPGWSKPVVVPWSNHPTTDRVLRLLRSRDTYWGNYIKLDSTVFFITAIQRFWRIICICLVKMSTILNATSIIQAKAGTLRPTFRSEGPAEGISQDFPSCSVWAGVQRVSYQVEEEKNNCIIFYHISSDRILFEHFTIDYFIT